MITNEIKHQLVHITWKDSYGCGHEWSTLEDAVVEPHYAQSVGWLVKENDEAVLIVPHVSPRHEDIGAREQGCGDMTIPKCSIVEMKQLTMVAVG